jgi:release factor glutamine methyltransferase
MTVHDHVMTARQRLVRAAIPDDEAAIDAELIARAVLGWDRATFLSKRRERPPDNFPPRFETLVTRRERREPMAYILGRREFWGLDFEVTPDVLVPRPETETLVEEALARARGGERMRLADVGTGSGCLAITLACRLPRARAVATDVSAAALQVARRNATRHGVLDRVRFVQADLLSGLHGPFELIVSNPPYIPTAALRDLQPEVRNYEPAGALAGGPDGLDVVRALLEQAATRLSAGGWLILEFGWGQAARLAAEIAARPVYELEVIQPDLQGIPRTAVIRRR